jgi:hypothetical protein
MLLVLEQAHAPGLLPQEAEIVGEPPLQRFLVGFRVPRDRSLDRTRQGKRCRLSTMYIEAWAGPEGPYLREESADPFDGHQNFSQND